MTTRTLAKSAWLPFGVGEGSLRLFLFPNAGGAASMFRRWRGNLGTAVDVCPVLLPGRERRLREPAYRRMDDLVAALDDALAPFMDRPFAFAGHSMGTGVAFELAHRLRAGRRAAPRAMILMGRQAPQLPPTRPAIHKESDNRFIEHLRELGGTPDEVLANDELMALLLPMLRADFELIESYRADPERPRLDCPFFVYGGEDDEDTPRDQLEPWRTLTRGMTRITIVPGGHFFLHDDPERFSARIENDLAPHVP